MVTITKEALLSFFFKTKLKMPQNSRFFYRQGLILRLSSYFYIQKHIPKFELNFLSYKSDLPLPYLR